MPASKANPTEDAKLPHKAKYNAVNVQTTNAKELKKDATVSKNIATYPARI